jgi:hypothetical protein
MASRYAALMVAMVLLAGCSALGGQGTPTATPTPPGHHELVFASGITPYEATITVTKDGETVAERTLEGDADGTYKQVATLESSGPYTVTVNATRGDRENTDSNRFRIDGDLGNATAVTMTWHGIYPETLELPRRNATHPVGDRIGYVNVTGSAVVNLDVRVSYQGEQLASRSLELTPDELTRVVPVERTGVYLVAARTDGGDWTNATVVLDDTGKFIEISVGARGDVKEIRVDDAYQWESR